MVVILGRVGMTKSLSGSGASPSASSFPSMVVGSVIRLPSVVEGVPEKTPVDELGLSVSSVALNVEFIPEPDPDPDPNSSISGSFVGGCMVPQYR